MLNSEKTFPLRNLTFKTPLRVLLENPLETWSEVAFSKTNGPMGMPFLLEIKGTDCVEKVDNFINLIKNIPLCSQRVEVLSENRKGVLITPNNNINSISSSASVVFIKGLINVRWTRVEYDNPDMKDATVDEINSRDITGFYLAKPRHANQIYDWATAYVKLARDLERMQVDVRRDSFGYRLRSSIKQVIQENNFPISRAMPSLLHFNQPSDETKEKQQALIKVLSEYI